MKLDSTAKAVLAIQFASIFLCAVIGALLGGLDHNMLGASLGGFIGFTIPGFVGSIVVARTKGGAGPIMQLLARVNDNKLLKSAERPAVEEIRGVSLIGWMGLLVAVLITGYFFTPVLVWRLAAGLIAMLACGFFARRCSRD